MRTVRVGVIGAGGISHAHMHGYLNLPDVEVVAVADVVPERARAWAEQYDVPSWYADHREMLEREHLHAVSICTYNRAHAEPSIAALEAGVHVLCEKPMADNLQDAYRMVKAAQGSGRILMVGLHNRFSPILKCARTFVRRGILGEIYYGEVTGARRRGIPGGTFIKRETAGGGAVLDLGVYLLDTALVLLGHPRPVAVSGVTQDYIGHHAAPVVGSWARNTKEMDVEEFGAAWIRFENGCALVFKIAWAAHIPSMGSSFFLGTKGGLQLHPLEIYRDEHGYMVNITPQGVSDLGWQERIDVEVAAFVEAVRRRRRSPIPPEEVIWTNVIMDGIYRSAAQGGREVPVGLPED